MVQITRGYHVNFSVWLSTIGIREKMADTEAETGKCPERIGMARATRPKDGTLERAAVQSCCEILCVHATDAMVCTGWWADLNLCYIPLCILWICTCTWPLKKRLLPSIPNHWNFIYTWNLPEQQQHRCRIKTLHVYNSRTYKRLSINSNGFRKFAFTGCRWSAWSSGVLWSGTFGEMVMHPGRGFTAVCDV